MIQSSVSEEEEKKEIDLTSKPLSKETGTSKRHPSNLLTNLSTSSLSGVLIDNHIVHALLLKESLPMEEALRLVESSLLSDSISLTDIDRVSIEQQLLSVCLMKDGKLSLIPERIATMAPGTFSCTGEEEEMIKKRMSSTLKQSSSETIDNEDDSKQEDDAKPKRTKKSQSKETEALSPLKELTLTIPNHVLRFDGYLLTPDLIEHMNTNMVLFLDYKERVEHGEME